MHTIPHSIRRLAVGMMFGLVACSPTLDWRDTQFPEADGATALFPCKPDRVVRRVPLAGEAVSFALASCSAGGLIFAVGHAELTRSSSAAAALDALQSIARQNINSVTNVSHPPLEVHVAGAAAEPPPRRVVLQGHRPDGSALAQQALFFAKGRRVYQASVIGPTIDAEVADTFFSGIRLPN